MKPECTVGVVTKSEGRRWAYTLGDMWEVGCTPKSVWSL